MAVKGFSLCLWVMNLLLKRGTGAICRLMVESEGGNVISYYTGEDTLVE